MGSSSPWLRWTQSELGSQEPKCWEEEEEDEDDEEEDFERHMDENGVIGLGAAAAELSDPQDSGSEWGQEAAGSPVWGECPLLLLNSWGRDRHAGGGLWVMGASGMVHAGGSAALQGMARTWMWGPRQSRAGMHSRT